MASTFFFYATFYNKPSSSSRAYPSTSTSDLPGNPVPREVSITPWAPLFAPMGYPPLPLTSIPPPPEGIRNGKVRSEWKCREKNLSWSQGSLIAGDILSIYISIPIGVGFERAQPPVWNDGHWIHNSSRDPYEKLLLLLLYCNMQTGLTCKTIVTRISWSLLLSFSTWIAL